MSDEESTELQSDTQLVAEYKDGKLQIVEVTSFDKSGNMIIEGGSSSNNEEYILSDTVELQSDGDGSNQKFMQVIDEKGLVQLDLLNLALVKCGDGSSSYRIVPAGSVAAGAAVACVLQEDDSGTDDTSEQHSYMVVDGEQGPVVVMRPTVEQRTETQPQAKPEKDQTVVTAELLERAKALQRAKAMIVRSHCGRGRRGRRGPTPANPLAMSSPSFKLYLYSCKLCSFKCNAIKELSAHRASAHSGARGPGAGRGALPLHCARCPHRAQSHALLMKHIDEKHNTEESVTITTSLDNLDAISSADPSSGDTESGFVLVCATCGFESGRRDTFREHVRRAHLQ